MGDTRPGDTPWVGSLAFATLVFIVAGGSSAPTAEVRLAITIVSLVGIAVAAWRLRFGLPTTIAKTGAFLVALLVLVFLTQLLPVPPALHTLFPGRESVNAATQLLGITAQYRPMTLSPAASQAAMLTIAPAIFMFLAALSVPPRNRIALIGILVGAAVINCLFGVAQKFNSSANWQLYDATAPGVATGFFANRNFFAAFLYSSIPLLGAVTLANVRERSLPGWLAATFAFVYLAIILSGLAAAQSRAGIILSMVAILATALLPWSSLNTLRTRNSRRVLMYAAFAFLFVFSQFGLAGILRLSSIDPMTDYRSVIFQVSWQTLSNFFPAGSGFGTFVPAYQLFETPESLRTLYVNHAHNDWIEIVLEGGAPALLLLAAFGAWFAWGVLRIWARRSDSPGDLVMSAASISAALLLLHSVVDYPLRTPALMSLLGLYLGFMAASFSVGRRPHPPHISAHPEARPAPLRRAPFEPFKPKHHYGVSTP